MTNKEFRYSLNSKIGKGVCPKCGEKKSFSFYVDNTTGEILNEQVGKCDRKYHCEYHYTPKEYFQSLGYVKQSSALVKQSKVLVKQSSTRVEQLSVRTKQFSTLQKEDLKGYTSCCLNNTLFKALQDKLSQRDYPLKDGRLEQVFSAYHVLTGTKGETVFLQIDHKDQIHTGKIMTYDATGHRTKGFSSQGNSVSWVHTFCQKKYPNFALKQCLFGQHFLGGVSYQIDRINVVESEKTALVMSVLQPDRLWLATGGCSLLNKEMFSFLMDVSVKDIVLYPDKGEYEHWKAKAREIVKYYYLQGRSTTIAVDNSLEQKPQVPANTDLADWFLDY